MYAKIVVLKNLLGRCQPYLKKKYVDSIFHMTLFRSKTH